MSRGLVDELAYNDKEPRYLMAGFAKDAQRYNAGSLSAARIDVMFRDASQ